MCCDIIRMWVEQFVALITNDKSTIGNAKTLKNTVTHWGYGWVLLPQQSQYAILSYFEKQWFWETMKSKKERYKGCNKLY